MLDSKQLEEAILDYIEARINMYKRERACIRRSHNVTHKEACKNMFYQELVQREYILKTALFELSDGERTL